MHEFHAWVGLSSSAIEDEGPTTKAVVERLRAMIATHKWHDASFTIENHNGQFFLLAIGFVNRRRDEGRLLDALLDEVSKSLPGSWGLVYERDDEMPAPPGPNAFRVRVVSRGAILEQTDPFLSPCRPRIED